MSSRITTSKIQRCPRHDFWQKSLLTVTRRRNLATLTLSVAARIAGAISLVIYQKFNNEIIVSSKHDRHDVHVHQLQPLQRQGLGGTAQIFSQQIRARGLESWGDRLYELSGILQEPVMPAGHKLKFHGLGGALQGCSRALCV